METYTYECHGCGCTRFDLILISHNVTYSELKE